MEPVNDVIDTSLVPTAFATSPADGTMRMPWPALMLAKVTAPAAVRVTETAATTEPPLMAPPEELAKTLPPELVRRLKAMSFPALMLMPVGDVTLWTVTASPAGISVGVAEVRYLNTVAR